LSIPKPQLRIGAFGQRHLHLALRERLRRARRRKRCGLPRTRDREQNESECARQPIHHGEPPTKPTMISPDRGEFTGRTEGRKDFWGSGAAPRIPRGLLSNKTPLS